jgi:hypothetical protein
MSKEIDDPRREFLVKALSLGLFGGSNFAGLYQASHAMGDVPHKLPDGRSIYQMQGSVTVDGKKADLMTPIGPNSHVKTGSNSRLVFVVASDAFFLRSNSELEMGSSGGLIIEGMRIVSGALLSVFGKREAPHTITTSTATIGIRGTGIYLESDPEQSYVCTCYGQTKITAVADKNISEDIVSEHHDKPVYILPSNAGNKLIVPAPFINHTDGELALIEELVGRTTPFSYSGAGYEVPRKRTY